jgi:hypothetical protein
VLVVDRLVTVAPEQIVRAVVASAVIAAGLTKPDHVLRIEQQDRAPPGELKRAPTPG